MPSTQHETSPTAPDEAAATFDFLVEVRGGVVVGIYARDLNARVFVLDWDHAVGQRCDCVDKVALLPIRTAPADAIGLIDGAARAAEKSKC
jgi:hypothetical protein